MRPLAGHLAKLKGASLQIAERLLPSDGRSSVARAANFRFPEGMTKASQLRHASGLA